MYSAQTGFNVSATKTLGRSTQFKEKQKAKIEKKEKKNFQTKYMEFVKQTIKMAMADKMSEQVERMAQRKASLLPLLWQQQQLYPLQPLFF